MAETTGNKTTAPKTTAARKPRTTAKAKKEVIVDHKTEAKAKFSKALEEAKAGAAELKAEAAGRAGVYRDQAKAKSADWAGEAKVYGDQAKVKARELAVEGKAKTSDALVGLGKLVSDNAGTIDDRFGTKYGDYARSASRTLQETAAKLDSKDLDQLAEDGREMVRKSPGMAVGIAALAGFLLASLFRRK